MLKNTLIITQLVCLFILCGCFIPYTTCTTCSYYKLPENANHLAYYYIKSAHKKSKTEFSGKQRVYFQRDRNYILHFKQCPNVKPFNVKVFVCEINEDNKIRIISDFSCINSYVAYLVFKVEIDGEYFIEVNTEKKINVHLILGEIK